jgi:hypothetical protein
MNGVTVQRLGKVVPGMRSEGGPVADLVDGAPIVLWAKGEPAAVLTYRSRMDGHDAVEELAAIPESVTGAVRGGAGALKLESRTRFPAEGHPAGPADALALRMAVTADVDGDGVDELVMPRAAGGVELVPWKGSALRLPGPSGKPAVASYAPVQAQVARLEGRAVVHLLFRRQVRGSANASELALIGAGEPYALVRADGSGLTRVRLEVGPVREVLAVGVVSRRGSSGVDELFAVSRKDASEDVWVSRHRPDGGAIGAARKVYVPMVAGGRWEVTFVPQSGLAVLTTTAAPAIWFLEPEKPANWIHRVDVANVVGDAIETYLGVADGAGKAKAVFRHADGVYAVDAEGRYQVVSGAAFVETKGEVPFQRLAGKGEDDATVVLPSAERGDEYLVVHVRKSGLRRVWHDELMQRADRHLDPQFVAEERHDAIPALGDRDLLRDRVMAEERARRGVTAPVRTVDEWRHLLPDSYAAVEKDRRARLDARISSDLFAPTEHPEWLSNGDYRDVEALNEWLATLVVGSSGSFEVVRRGTPFQAFTVDTDLRWASSESGRAPIAWRAGSGGSVVVTSAAIGGEKRKPEPGVYVIRATSGGR